MNRFFRPTVAASAAMVLAAGIAGAVTIPVQSVSITASADLTTDNDYTRIATACASAVDGDVIELEGMFDWSEANAYAATPWYGVFFSDISDLTIKAKDGTVSGITQSDTAAMATENPAVAGEPTQWQNSFFLPYSNVTNITFDGLTLINGDAMIYCYEANQNINGVTIKNCDITTGLYNAPFEIASWYYGFNQGLFIGRYTQNVVIENNTFTMINNAPGELPVEHEGLWPQLRMVNTRMAVSTMDGDLDIKGNTFNMANDPTMPNADSPVLMTWTYTLFNNNTNQGAFNQAYDDNTFNGGIDIGGTTYPMMTCAIITGARTGEFTGEAGVTTHDNNIFNDVLTAYRLDAFWDPNDADEVVVAQNNTFTNCGWVDSLIDPWNGGNLKDRVEETYPGQSVIKNLSGSSTYGDEGPIKFYIELPWTIDGQTAYYTDGTDFSYAGLHEIANQPSFFTAVPDGVGGYIDAGVYAVEVITPAMTPVEDPAYNGLQRFSAPAGEPNEVVGYTVVGDVDPTEPPAGRSTDEFAAGNVPDNTVIEIPFGTTLDVVPGSVIDQNITFRGVDAPVKAGADAPMAVIEPTNLNFGAAMFEVAAGGSLTLENVMLKGVSDVLPGTMNVLKGIRVDGASATVSLDKVSATGFVADIVDLTDNSDGSVVTVTDCHIFDSAKGMATNANTTVTVDSNIFDNVGLPFSIRQGDLTVIRNSFVDTPDWFATSPAVNLTYGAAGQGNLHFTNFYPGFGGNTAVGSGVSTVENNWFVGAYGEGVNDDNGIIVGDVDVYGSPVDVEAGVINWISNSNTVDPLVCSNIIAQFDRDLDALPDAWEIGGVTGYTSFDSDNDGWPDGVEVAEGTNPNDNADYPAGTFDINADVDENGTADWYEAALMANVGIEPFIGNVERTGSVGLTDAVRSLQIVNGAFGAKDMSDGDLNALDVTALGPNSLGNPLQILRFQAGVRSKLPALSGID